MSRSTKEISYWLVVILYGVALFSVLLYLRFPKDKFRNFCEGYCESKFENVECVIERISYVFPRDIVFTNIRLSNKETEELILEDPQLILKPLWNKPLSHLDMHSNLLGGNTTATLRIDNDNKVMRVDDISLSGIGLEKMAQVISGIDRKMGGEMGITGSAVVTTEKVALVEAEGQVALRSGKIELKNPILELRELEIVEGVLSFSIRDNKLELLDGEIKNDKLNTTFQGNVTLASPLHSGLVSLQGSVNPQLGLYKKNRQLKVIVGRMQKRYKSEALPFSLAGTVGKPTFVFGK